MENTTAIACEIAERCIDEFKNNMGAPLTYTESCEDGTRILNYTDFGQKLYDIIYKNVKQELENASK
jgi:hypothetical protein